MRKRRILADKLTIIVCAVLVAVSAFFYAPMDVRASVDTYSDTVKITESTVNRQIHIARSLGNSMSLPSVSSLIPGKYYVIEYSGTLGLKISQSCNVNTQSLILHFGDYDISLYSRKSSFPFSSNEVNESNFSGSFVYRAVDNPVFLYDFIATISKSTSSSFSYTATHYLDFNIDSITELSNTDSDDYQNGYDAGYSAGQSAGYGSGYSEGFADGEASVDSDLIYDEGFQAGKDSVDTDSYYDAGYQAGYQVAFSEGYESGYDEGYQSAMDRIDGWGADTVQYPLLLSESGEPFNLQFDFIEEGSDEFVYSDYSDVERYYPDVDFNPNHTYKLEFSYHDFTYDYDTFFTSSFSFWLYWGDSSFPLIVGTKNDITTTVFIPGDRVGNGLRFRCDLGQIESNGSIDTLHYYLNGCYLKLYDIGPSGDTQNHIANQTDSLTNGFDNSQGNSVNSDLSTGLNEFETAEDSLFATATTGLKDFTFFDIQSVPAMVTGMSFVGSIMSGWFTQAGGASGVGIVLSILFSIMLVAMVLGLYRWYQSKGGKD